MYHVHPFYKPWAKVPTHHKPFPQKKTNQKEKIPDQKIGRKQKEKILNQRLRTKYTLL